VRQVAPLTALALLGVTAVSALAERSPSAGPSQGRLVVTERTVDSGGVYAEGAYYYLELSRPGGQHVFRRRYEDRIHLNRRFPAGRYRLASYARACAGSCDYLDKPSDRCAREFTLPRDERVHLVVRIAAGKPCRIRVREPG
jgi:hypothetical protein